MLTIRFDSLLNYFLNPIDDDESGEEDGDDSSTDTSEAGKKGDKHGVDSGDISLPL